MAFSRNRKKNHFIIAFKKHRGNTSKACKATHISSKSINKWIEDDPIFRAAIYETTEEVLDFVESKLMENIKAGKERSIHFYLQTKGKHRGYTIQTDTRVAPMDAEIASMSDEQLDAEINELENGPEIKQIGQGEDPQVEEGEEPTIDGEIL